MQIGWVSHKGRERLSNNDAAAFGRKGPYVLAMIVDAAERGDGQGLARHWSRTVIEVALGEPLPLSFAGLADIMRAEQRRLRQRHLHAIASYCCVLIDLSQQLLHVASVGDCLLGVQRPGESINWLNRPQNLHNQSIWPQDARQLEESRHVLTRSLNARRFHAPDCLTTSLPLNARLLLCSDGYWHEHLYSDIDLHGTKDDASVLSLECGEPTIELRSDCDNLLECMQTTMTGSSA
ncbi:SpoIIE family protein phosphatase [Pseudomonas sp. 21LCFQ02]|uniref:SpoIIE family protein phosphatase n=1 Tax=Pseudomonas sp. 21LCFQ02 TaxID=2957505 RepID=UPI00209B6789|nr:SpoIIE family protein phosphatase [Pseudomonas sp. 21LCFQ02]MCO8168314.1 SpoIIE family protein phosphatase [Pseudomonas sp. 21LCFQ02]